MTKNLFARVAAIFSHFLALLGVKRKKRAEVIEPKPGKRYIVVDLEWNQYPKWIKTPVSDEGVVMPHEIIQIGAIKVDEDFMPIDAFRMGVRLQGRRKLSKHVARVIQKTQEEIDQGCDFPVAYAYFLEWSKNADRFITWGKDDYKVFENNLAYYGLGTLDASRWFDAQHIYARQVRGDSVQTSLEKAAEVLGVEDSVTHHDALNDAYITVGVCGCLDMENGMAGLPAETQAAPMPLMSLKKNESVLFLHKEFVSASSENGFETRSAAKRQCEVTRPLCPACYNAMKLEATRISNGDRWMRMATCKEHGKHLTRFRVRHRQDGSFAWSQTIYAPDADLERYYREKVAQKQARMRQAHKKADGKQEIAMSTAAGARG